MCRHGLLGKLARAIAQRLIAKRVNEGAQIRCEMVTIVNGAQLHIEASHIERPGGRLARLGVLEQRLQIPEVLVLGIDRMSSASGSRRCSDTNRSGKARSEPWERCSTGRRRQE